MPDKLYLMLAKEDKNAPEWYKKTTENTATIKGQLGFTFEGKIQEVYVKFTEFKDVFKNINDIIQEHNSKGKTRKQEKPQFFIDITSTPLLPKIALISVAAIHPNVTVYYTPPSERQPMEYRLDIVEHDSGLKPVTIPIVKSQTLDQLLKKKYHKEVLFALRNSNDNRVSSMAELLKLLQLDTSHGKYMLLGRILDSLESFGLVNVSYSGRKEREREVELTVLGDALAESLLGKKPK